MPIENNNLSTLQWCNHVPSPTIGWWRVIQSQVPKSWLSVCQNFCGHKLFKCLCLLSFNPFTISLLLIIGRIGSGSKLSFTRRMLEPVWPGLYQHPTWELIDYFNPRPSELVEMTPVKSSTFCGSASLTLRKSSC